MGTGGKGMGISLRKKEHRREAKEMLKKGLIVFSLAIAVIIQSRLSAGNRKVFGEKVWQEVHYKPGGGASLFGKPNPRC